MMKRVAFLLLAALLAGCGSSGPTPLPGAADKLASNIATMTAEPWYPDLALYHGRPQVQVVDDDAFVFFTAAVKSTADTVCQAIAGIAHDPDTGVSLDLTSIVIMVGNNDNAAQCQP